MTFWEEYGIYLKEKSLSTLTVISAGLLTAFIIKYWTGKHYLLDKRMEGMSIERFLISHAIGIGVGLLVMSAIQVYINRKYDKE